VGSERLGIKPSRSWREAVVRWLEETSEKATHKEDKKKLIWLHPLLGDLNLDQVTSDVIDQVRSAKLKEASKGTSNRYLALVRAILIRARDEWEWVDKVPKIRLFKETMSRERSLTVEQAGRLLDELPTHQRDMVLFSLATGLRQGNCLEARLVTGESRSVSCVDTGLAIKEPPPYRCAAKRHGIIGATSADRETS
jgi:integrase